MTSFEGFRQQCVRTQWAQDSADNFSFTYSPPCGPSVWCRGDRIQPIYLSAFSHEQMEQSASAHSVALNRRKTAFELEAAVELGKSIGYNIGTVNKTEMRLILADALTSIEKLTHGCVFTRRPRELSVEQIGKHLNERVPSSYRVAVRIDRLLSEKDEFWAELGVLILAAKEYLEELEGDRMYGHRKEGAADIVRTKQRASRGVCEVLRRIECWCDDWLNGTLKDDDWDEFQNCLDWAA